MSTLIIHTQFAAAFQLDSTAVNMLSALYYQQKQNDGQPITLTQSHITNLCAVGKYAQRRVRAALIEKNLLREHRRVELVEEKGWRTFMYYNVNIKKLDALLVDVDAKRTAQAQGKTQPATINDQPSMPAVAMNLTWEPNADQLASYLNAYQIDSRFAVMDVLPEFREYWAGIQCSFRPAQWQTKFHAAVRHQWARHLSRETNQQIIDQAISAKAQAIANLKYAQAASIAPARAPKTTMDRLTDRSWAEGLDLDMFRGEM